MWKTSIKVERHSEAFSDTLKNTVYFPVLGVTKGCALRVTSKQATKQEEVESPPRRGLILLSPLVTSLLLCLSLHLCLHLSLPFLYFLFPLLFRALTPHLRVPTKPPHFIIQSNPVVSLSPWPALVTLWELPLYFPEQSNPSIGNSLSPPCCTAGSFNICRHLSPATTIKNGSAKRSCSLSKSGFQIYLFYCFSVF